MVIDYAFLPLRQKQKLKQSRVFCESVYIKLEGKDSRQRHLEAVGFVPPEVFMWVHQLYPTCVLTHGLHE